MGERHRSDVLPGLPGVPARSPTWLPEWNGGKTRCQDFDRLPRTNAPRPHLLPEPRLPDSRGLGSLTLQKRKGELATRKQGSGRAGGEAKGARNPDASATDVGTPENRRRATPSGERRSGDPRGAARGSSAAELRTRFCVPPSPCRCFNCAGGALSWRAAARPAGSSEHSSG